MKKVLFLLFAVMVFTSCEDACDVQEDIDTLRIERDELTYECKNLRSQENEGREKLNNLMDIVKETQIYANGKTPTYVLKFELKQSHMSLDIGQHLKDEMNAIEFELPVNKDFYHSVSVGSNIVDEFRAGSAILNGSFGSWKMVVIDKNIFE